MSVQFSNTSQYVFIDRPGLRPRSTPTNFYGDSRESTNRRKRPADFHGRALKYTLKQFSHFLIGAGAAYALYLLSQCVSGRRGGTQKRSKSRSNSRTRRSTYSDIDANQIEHILEHHPSIYRTLKEQGCPINDDRKKTLELIRILKKYA
jgi:hypothetical protein